MGLPESSFYDHEHDEQCADSDLLNEIKQDLIDPEGKTVYCEINNKNYPYNFSDVMAQCDIDALEKATLQTVAAKLPLEIMIAHRDMGEIIIKAAGEVAERIFEGVKLSKGSAV